MNNVNYLINKKNRPIYNPNIESCFTEEAVMAEIPLLGWVAAGVPIDLFENRESVSVPANMVLKNSYALRVRGDSMIDDNIQDGDIIIIQKRVSAENGQSVIAMINGEQVTLKKFYVERDGIRLQPANSDMKPIYLRNEDVQILGIVTGVIRSLN